MIRIIFLLAIITLLGCNNRKSKVNKSENDIPSKETLHDWEVYINNVFYEKSKYRVLKDTISHDIIYMTNLFFFKTRKLSLKDTLTFVRENPRFLLPKEFKVIVKEFRTKQILDTLYLNSLSPKKFSVLVKDIEYWEQEKLIDFYFIIDDKVIDDDLIFLRANIWDAPFFDDSYDNES